ncbi:hypothetical protein BH23ACT9_BH23ACT9_03980 [soil metagenome]
MTAQQATTPVPDRPAITRIWWVVGVTASVSLMATVLLDWTTPTGTDLLIAIGLCAAVAATERWASLTVRIGDQTHNLTLSELPLVVGLFALPHAWPLLVLSRTAGVLIGLQVLRRQEAHKTAFNVAHLWAETLLAIAAFTLIAPRSLTDGGRVTLTVLTVAMVVATVGGIGMAVVASVMSGTLRADLVLRGIREGMGPSLMTSAAAVVSLALVETSPALLWAPIAIMAALLVAYRAHVRLIEANTMQQRLLSFTQQITGEAGLRATAEQVCATTRSLMDAPTAALRVPDIDGVDHRWIGIAPADAALMDHRLAVEMAGGPHDGCCPEGADLTLLATVGAIEGCWLAVTMAASTVDVHDRSSLSMIANHAAVALANARRGQALQQQALDAQHHANHDALTGLPNRAHLLSHIRDAIADQRPFGLLVIDLDDFKQINDALGHAVGDTVLTEVTRRLGPAGRHARVVARLGGDEFAAVIGGGEAVCRELADRLRDAIAQPVNVGPYTIEVGSSTGVALYPAHGTDPDELLKNADLAMYEAKDTGGGASVFGAAAGGRAMRHLAISSGFRSALHGGDIAVAFQPVIDLQSEQLLSVEALARWTHPELGPIGPDEFVRVAEQAGLITELTHQVIDTALGWQSSWAAAGLNIGVSVNLSARSLLDMDLPLHVARQLDDHAVDPGRLTLELTESSVISDPTRTMAVLQRLSSLGLRLSIDDFGTGYSSLAYLRQLPADEVKIDKSFILPVGREPGATALVSGIVNLCHELGYDVVAEGVETAEVQGTLAELGCDRGQGYDIARPMPGGDILSWATQRHLSRAARAALAARGAVDNSPVRPSAACCRAATMSGLARVVASPSSVPSAICFSRRRMILPDRVLGRSGVK